MPLIKYAQYLTYADGSPATPGPFPVRLMGGNIHVPLFSDKAGTVPVANPVTTDANGLASFYAAPGHYFTDISGNVFHYAVDPSETDPAWPGTFVHEQTTQATVWTVAHHLGVEPSVTVLIDGQTVLADVTHPDDETTVITLGTPRTGTAHLRR